MEDAKGQASWGTISFAAHAEGLALLLLGRCRVSGVMARASANHMSVVITAEDLALCL